MIQVMNKRGTVVKAYRLGLPHPVLDALMAEKRLIDLHDGTYEVFSQEAVLGGSGHGQLARAGQWIRVDSAGFPYPNADEWVRANLRHIGGDDFEKLQKPLNAWQADMPMCPQIQFLIRQKGLELNEEDPDHYFSAVIQGTRESAARDATLIFYSISQDEEGNVTDAEFHFIEKTEFDRTYDILA